MWVICSVVLCKMCTESIKKHNYQGHLPSLMNHAVWFIPRHFFLVWILVKAAVCWAITSGNTELRVFFSGLASDISRIHVARTTSHKANVLMRCLVLFSFDNFWDRRLRKPNNFSVLVLLITILLITMIMIMSIIKPIRTHLLPFHSPV